MNDKSPILNLETINELKEILEDDILSIYNEFKTGTGRMIQDLKKAHDEGDHESLLLLAHTIKGSSANIGLQQMYGITQKIEHNLRENNHRDIIMLIQETESAYTNALTALIEEGLLTE